MHHAGLISRLILGGAVLFGVFAVSATASAATPSVELSATTINTGDPVSLHLIVVNPGEQVINPKLPSTIVGTIQSGIESAALEFSVDASVLINELAIAPTRFARVRYQAELPTRFPVGTAVLSLSLPGAPTFQIEVTGEKISAIETADAEQPSARRFSLRSAKEEGSTELNFFQRHMFPYEPMYFIAGPDAPTAKFQISFKYRLVNTTTNGNGNAVGWLYRKAPWTDGFHFAYTQLSLWDLGGESSPFFDSNYMPEFFYEQLELFGPDSGWIDRAGFRVGLHHESNGRGGSDSRSINLAYLALPIVLGDENAFHFTFQPQAWTYVGDLSDNPDIAFYRGYVDLKTKLGWSDGIELATHLRAGDEFNRGSVQLDLTYPLHTLLSRSFSFYLQAQYFNGYGESLLSYDQRTESWRVGIGLFR